MKLLQTLSIAAALSIATSSFANIDIKPVIQSYRIIKSAIKTQPLTLKVGGYSICDECYNGIRESCEEDGGDNCSSDREFREAIEFLGGVYAACSEMETGWREIQKCEHILNYYLENCPIHN